MHRTVPIKTAFVSYPRSEHNAIALCASRCLCSRALGSLLIQCTIFVRDLCFALANVTALSFLLVRIRLGRRIPFTVLCLRIAKVRLTTYLMVRSRLVRWISMEDVSGFCFVFGWQICLGYCSRSMVTWTCMRRVGMCGGQMMAAAMTHNTHRSEQEQQKHWRLPMCLLSNYAQREISVFCKVYFAPWLYRSVCGCCRLLIRMC